MIKALKKLGIEGTHLNIIETINDKPTVSVVLNGENPKTFALKSGRSQGCPLSPLLFNTLPKLLSTAIRQEKEIKETQIVKSQYLHLQIL
jgi:hypothetical protein